MTRSQVDSAMAKEYDAVFVAEHEAEDHPETGGWLRIYERRVNPKVRLLVEADPDGAVTVFRPVRRLDIVEPGA